MKNEDAAFGPGMMFGIKGEDTYDKIKNSDSLKNTHKLFQSFKKFKKEKDSNDIIEAEILNEIGDSSSKPYEWSSSMPSGKWIEKCISSLEKGFRDHQYLTYSNLEFKYFFNTDETDKRYFVKVFGDFKKSKPLGVFRIKPKDWQPYNYAYFTIDFGIFKDGYDDEYDFPTTNSGVPYRIMATVSQCILDLLDSALKEPYFQVIRFVFSPSIEDDRSEAINSRRGKLYMKYIQDIMKKKIPSNLKTKTEIQKYGFLITIKK